MLIREAVNWSDWGIWLDREQSQIGFFSSRKDPYFPSLLRDMFWVTTLYKYHEQIGCMFSTKVVDPDGVDSDPRLENKPDLDPNQNPDPC